MNILLTAGGTGGHILPAVSLANELKVNNNINLIVSKRQIDYEILNKTNLNATHLSMSGFNRKLSLYSLVENFLNIFRSLYVFLYSLNFIKKHQINKVVGFGGYITLPVIFAAKILKCDIYIHEQNSFPGLVNAKMAKHAKKIFYTYESSVSYFPPKSNCIFTSNPRVNDTSSYLNLKRKEFALFLGGSLGAEIINQLAFDFAKQTNKQVILVCGDRYKTEITNKPNNLTLYSFLDNPIELIATAGLIITRGGATTLIECDALGSRTIVIPSKNVVANHQEMNARELEKNGNIKTILEDQVSVDAIIKCIEENQFSETQYQFNSIKTIISEMEV